jgi:Pyruvate/2-oxoacid:ferredoxin oxidoreductase delta subunit
MREALPGAEHSHFAGKPIWQHTCEQCFACLQWCPEEAIQYGKNTKKKRRYHHPEIRLRDMFSHVGKD